MGRRVSIGTRRTHHVVLHRPVLPGVEAMALRSDHVFPRHTHDGFGLGVMTEGAQRSWSGIGEVEALPGDVIAVNPGEVHDGTPLGGARAWRILYLEPEVMRREAEEVGEDHPEIARPAVHDPVLAALLMRLFDLAAAPQADPLALEEALLRAVAAVTLRHGARRRPVGGAHPAISAARRRLDEAPELPVTLGELAGMARLSRFQLLRGFRHETGLTPHAYLLQRRVRLARRLILQGAPLAEAAAGAGFADQSHLTRAFARQYGVTPGQYRAARR